MSIKNYPYIGFFTNNPYDIRGLEFIELYKNNKSKLSDNVSGEKILKFKYYKLIEEHYNFINTILKIDKYNPFIEKWLFDFFSRFIKFDKYTIINTFIDYEDNYDIILEIVKTLEDVPGNKDYITSAIKELIKIENINPLDEEAIYDLIKRFTGGIGNYIESIFIEFDKYYNIEDETTSSIIDSSNYKNNFPSPKEYPLDKIFEHNSFESDYKKSFERVLKINKNLTKKYELFFKIQKYNNNDKKKNIDLENNNWKKSYINKGHCIGILLNISDDECSKLLIDVLKEDGYGLMSQELFENDNNFIIYERINSIKKLNYANMQLIMQLLKKLQFKIKIKNISYFDKNIPRYVKVPPKNIKLKYYESFNSWKKHQTISDKLNNQPYLKEYLDTCINIINRRLSYLNSEYDSYSDLTQEMYPLYKSLSPLENLKHQYKKLQELFKDEEPELDKVIINLKHNSKYIQSLIGPNIDVINYNYRNNLGLIMSLINNPSEHNLIQLSYILNTSYKFNKSLFEI